MLLSINPDHPEPRKVRRAVDALEAGEVIAYPTDTVYGLGCDLTNKKAIERLYAIKRMDRSHPLAFICPDLSDIARYADRREPARTACSGTSCRGRTASSSRRRAKCRSSFRSKRKTVGIRIPDCEAMRAIARELGRPIISTTAAPRRRPLRRPARNRHRLPGLALVLDGGAGGLVPTTVIDLTTVPPEIVREGAGDTNDFR